MLSAKSTLRGSFQSFHDEQDFCDWVSGNSGLLLKYSYLRGEAAVLVLLRETAKGTEVFLIRRSNAVSTHKQEVALPGGLREPADKNPVETALREAYEETGLPRDYVQIVASLKPLRMMYGYAVFPVVGFLKQNCFVARCNSEVELCFWLPLNRFLSSDGHEAGSLKFNDLEIRIHSFHDEIPELKEKVVTFGLTSAICVIVAMIRFQMKPNFPFPDDFGEGASKKLHDRSSWSDVVRHVLNASFRSLTAPHEMVEKSRL